jgi:hypothetical protein
MARRRALIRQGGRPIGAVAELVRVPALVGGTALAAAGFATELNRVLERRLREAEQRAEREGLEAGRLAGVEDPAARMDPDTVRGAAFNRGAIETGARRLETQLRARLDELAREHAADPGTLQAAAEEYIAGVAQSLPNDLRPIFQTAAETALRPYVTQAAREQERAVADERLASFWETTRTRLNDITRNARNAAADPAAAAALRQDLDALRLDLVAMGPRTAFTFRGVRYEADPTRAGAISVLEMERQLAAIERETAEQAALGAYERGPRTNAWIDGWVRRARQLGVPGLDQDGIDRVEARMRTDATRREHEAERAAARAERREMARLRLLGRAITEAERLARAGYMPANIDQLAEAAAGTELADAVRDVRETALQVQSFRLLPAATQIGAIRTLNERLEAGAGTARDVAQRDLFLSVFTAQQRAAEADALSAYATSTGAILPPLDLTNPESLNDRVRLAEEAAVHFGRPAAPFTAAEAERLVARFNEARTPEEMAAVLEPFINAPPEVRQAAVQMFERQRGDNRLPAGTMALVMDALRDQNNRRNALSLLSGLLAPAPTPDQADSPLLRTAIENSMDEGVSGARREAMRVSGDNRPAALDERDRKLIERLARQNLAAGLSPREAVDRARALLYGHLRTIDKRNFAHVYLPATVDANTFERGLRVLRLEAAMKVLEAPEPPREGAAARGDAVAIDRQRWLDRAFALSERGVWINDGGGFALVAPETGEPIGLRERLQPVTVDEVLAAGRRVAGTDEELKRRFQQRLNELRNQFQQSSQPPNRQQRATAGPPPPADAAQPVIAP